MMGRVLLALAVGLACGTGTSAARADDAPEWIQKLAPDLQSPAMKRFQEQQKSRVEKERELKKIRAHYFRVARPESMRLEGIAKIRDYNEPALYPSLIEIFSTEAIDVRLAVLDLFRDQKSEEGDASLSWVGVFDKDAVIRGAATDRLLERVTEVKKDKHTLCDGAKLVMYQALTRGNETEKASAAKMASALGVLEAIPWMIATQVQGQAATGGGGGDRNGALAWIMIGTQQSFVSDLTPIVGPNAVAFDPQLSVVNEGAIMRVLDAAVITYHVDINNALIDLTSREWGQPTRPLGWNIPAWREWYAKDFLPHLKAKREAEKARMLAEAGKK
jgi:hypothetical protein